MKKVIVLIFLGVVLAYTVQAQRYMTKNGKISFFSEAPLENIEAHNNQVNFALNTQTGDILAKVLIKSFVFEKALMQEHFNENYMESDTYPNSMLKGKITNLNAVDFTKDGIYEVLIEGDLTIHGVTKPVAEKGTFEVKGSQITGKCEFSVLVSDYGIKIPATVADNIAKEIEVTVDVVLDKVVE
jgi:hypothetical protein